MFSGDIYIFGAKSTAIGLIRAIKNQYEDCRIKGCIVSSMKGNPDEIEGIKVSELRSFSAKIPEEMKASVRIIIATPIYVQGEIRDTLRMFGFKNIIGLDTKMEESVMSRYFEDIGYFQSLNSLSKGKVMPKTCVLEVKHCMDRTLKNFYKNDPWVKSIQAGAANTEERISSLLDSDGDNISEMNALYCEETALYWMWKNMINNPQEDYEYYGLYQYRRVLNVTEENLKSIRAENVDVVLPYPMIHLPNIKEHHGRYANEMEWDMLLKAVSELEPEYSADYERIFSSPYMYNYNMFVAKREVVEDYCRWLFPIMFRTEELCKSAEAPFTKRYLAYFAESLLTWYFMHNAYKLNIVHTGRILRE